MYNETDNYKAILTLLKPKESVAKALRRLGGGKKTTAQKLKEKKRQKEGKETQEEKRNREDMAQLTSLADAILSRSGESSKAIQVIVGTFALSLPSCSGHMEIYEETFESITFKLKEIDGKKAAERTEIPEGVDDDDALDMFMESAKEREEDKSSKPSSSQQEGATEEAANPPETLSMEDEVTTEFANPQFAILFFSHFPP
jgi:CD2 antigen cytoplasmic tail-binding protein 2